MAGKLIALTGERGVGKDHLTDVAVKTIGAVRLSFSDEVRRIAYAIFPFLPNYTADKNAPIIGEPTNPGNLSWRDIVKMVGKLCRSVDPAFFVKAFIKNQYSLVLEAEDDTLFLITDLRTEDEWNFLQSVNCPVVKLLAETGLEPDDFEQWTRDFTDFVVSFSNHFQLEDEAKFLETIRDLK